MSRLQALDKPSVESRSLRAGCGVLRGAVDRAARAAGLRFPVDPSSGEFCTIGGMASTNAAGPHSLLHGSMRRWVLTLDCVFDDGTQATVRRGGALPDVPALQRFMQSVHPDLVGDDRARDEHVGVLKDSSGYATAEIRGIAGHR